MKTMKISWLLMPALSLGLTLGGCAVAPAHDVGYADDDRDYVRNTVIVTAAPQVGYRTYPPAANTIWIDGYWNRSGRQQTWVPGYWAPPTLHARPPPRYWRDDGGRRLEALRTRERELAQAREREHAREIRRERRQEGRESADKPQRRWEDERTRSEAREQVTLPTSGRSPLTLGERPRLRAEPRTENQVGSPPRAGRHERFERSERLQRDAREARPERGRGDDSGRDMRHQRRFPRAGQE